MDNNYTVVFPEPQKVVLEEGPVPQPGPGEVLIRTKVSLISTGTELTIFSGEFGKEWGRYGKFPFRAGYCNVGEVVETGAGVDAAWKGRRVASSAKHAAWVAPALEHVYPIPDQVTDDEAAFFSLASTAMNGIRMGNLAWGEAVVIYGLGLLGQLTARFCALAGARPVIGIDLSETRLNLLPEIPGITGLPGQDKELAEKVNDLTNTRGADVVFEVTGNKDLIPKEFEFLKPRGRFVLLGCPRGVTSFDFHDLCSYHGYTIIGAHVRNRPMKETPDNQWTRARNIELFFRHIGEGEVDLKPLISNKEKAEKAPEIYPRLFCDRNQVMGVLLNWQE